MRHLLPIIYATIAAVDNAIFAFGQKKSNYNDNGLLFVGLSGLLAGILSLCFSPLIGPFDLS